MTEEESFQAAVEQVASQAEACLPPELDTGELEALVRGSQAARTWLPNTAYAVGDTVTADPPNGIVYICTTAGTSGATQPDWPAFIPHGCCNAPSVSDGTAGWAATSTYVRLFDTAQATFEAWLKKTGKASVLVQTSSAGQSWASQQVFTHCQQMAAHWQPTRVA